MTIYQINQHHYRSLIPIAYCKTLNLAKEYISMVIPTATRDVCQFTYDRGLRKNIRWYDGSETLDMITEDNVKEFEIMEDNGSYHFQVYSILPLEVIE